MDDFIIVMKALSDSTRVRILKILQNKTLCVCEIQELMNMAQPAVSKHMKILERAGLVRSEREGLWVYYSLKYGSENLFAASLLGNLRHWLSGDIALADMEKRMPDVTRKSGCKRNNKGEGTNV
ncbi:MAG: metalloregulator ArsR/SmtB family transcription factor [Smithellaceae bacterium]